MTSGEDFLLHRQKTLSAMLQGEDLDVFWVSDLTHIRYLTGFTGSSAELIVTPEENIFITDGRYEEQVTSEVVGCRIEVFHRGSWTRVFASLVGEYGWECVGFEADHVSVHNLESLKNLPDLPTRLSWEPVVGRIERMRLVKDSFEMDLLKRSSQIVDRVFEALLPDLEVGVTERGVFRRMMNLLWEFGAEGSSFDPIVLFGERSSLPHGKPGERSLKEGDWILIDFGALFEGYCSDCTRTFVFGEPNDLQTSRHELVRKAQLAAMEKALPGARCSDLDAAAREVLTQGGLGEAFIHGLGHGIGLEIHEGPRVNSTSETVLEEGMVITIEPGIYVPQWGGIRIEDAVIIRSTGPEPLTKYDHSIQPWNNP